MTRRWLILCWALGAAAATAQQAPPLIPYSPTVIQDKKGNEWYIEQNGALQRNGSTPSLIGNAMMLYVGAQQFYSQQPMATPDGTDITATSPQPVNGVSITRRITLLDREGALRYVETFANTTTRDLTLSVELRHSFSNQNRPLQSNAGRAIKDTLEGEEFGVLVQSSNQNEAAPAVLLSLGAPGSTASPRITSRRGYEVSVIYTLTVPAGRSAAIVHGISQARLGAAPKAEDLARAFQPITPRRLTKSLAKDVLRILANADAQSLGPGAVDWFPGTFWDVAPESSDILVLDGASHLKGHVNAASVKLSTAFGEVTVKWDDVAACAGPGYAGVEQSWLWLRDGQKWRGTLEPAALKFVLTGGSAVELPHPNRLILHRAAEPQPRLAQGSGMMELVSGERFAFEPQGSLKVDTPWGPWAVPWAEVVTLGSADSETFGGLLRLRDGTRLRVLPTPERVSVQTKSFGRREIDFTRLRRAATAEALNAQAEDEEPTLSFTELPGDQRLVGRVTTERLRFLTPAGPVDLAPAAIREMSLATEDAPASAARAEFQAELWGGGTLAGVLDNAFLTVAGNGYTWDLPAACLTRMVNPAPVADNALLRRTGDLIQMLGDAEWKKREKAQAELKELGLLARPSLQEALKQATDAEIKRRLETLLSDLD